VDPGDVSEIVNAIRSALINDALVDNAARANYKLANDGFSKASISSRIESYYFGADDKI
jgi:glycosyltransferase involved in cell wall biosynthesis